MWMETDGSAELSAVALRILTYLAAFLLKFVFTEWCAAFVPSDRRPVVMLSSQEDQVR
jgi:hypothetical protein